MGSTQADPSAELHKRLQDMNAQVHVLEQKLADVHGMDATSLDRAHRTMCQHVDALDADSKGMSEAIESIETALITPDSVADEMCAVGLITGGMLLLHRGIVTLAPIRSALTLWRGCCVLGVAYIGWRLSSGAARRLAAVTSGNRRHKQELLNIWEGIAERIHIMQSLASTAPVVAHAEEAYTATPLPLQQHAPQAYPHASAPPLES